jgi:hypothetical protein
VIACVAERLASHFDPPEIDTFPPTNMRLLTLPLTLLASWGAPVLASCGYGTFLQPRQADDEQVPINTFGYSGDNVTNLTPVTALVPVPVRS